jgi:two-component system phosphate regulon response regulator PhoB
LTTQSGAYALIPSSARAQATAGTILVVDDESDIVDVLAHVLTREGFSVVSAMDGRAAVELARSRTPDLVLLDWMLPEMSGMEVMKFLRADQKTRTIPVILVTARREEIDRVLAFELGADDYVMKPFSPREVVLRVRAVLRRRAVASHADGGTLAAGPIRIDLGTYHAWVGETPVVLTVTEFKLLADLIQARGRVRTRDWLLSEVWGYKAEVLSRTVDTHVRRLRDKLGPAAAWIETVRGVGYRIRDPESAV